MTTKLYIGNLSYDTSADDLRLLFAQAGEVSSLDLITDRATGQSKGFAFVTYAADADAQNAIRMFEGFTIHDRTMRVSVAKPREERAGVPVRGGAFGAGFSGQRSGHKRRGGNR
jgi:RNA recognition motif-containing protein